MTRDLERTEQITDALRAADIEGYGGLRHCDKIAVTQKGAELLTPFQSTVEGLVVATRTAQGG